jgi:hypothetical protein
LWSFASVGGGCRDTGTYDRWTPGESYKLGSGRRSGSRADEEFCQLAGVSYKIEYELTLLEAGFVGGSKTVPVNEGCDVGSPSVSLEDVGNEIAISLVFADGT